MLAGMTIFLCGLVRTYHIDKAMTQTPTEEYMLKTLNEYFQWWIGLPVRFIAYSTVCESLELPQVPRSLYAAKICA